MELTVTFGLGNKNYTEGKPMFTSCSYELDSIK